MDLYELCYWRLGYSPVGLTLIFVVGLFSPNVWLAVIIGAAVIFGEVMLLNYIAKFLDKYPGVHHSGENIRSAMTYLLNEISGRQIVRMAVGPVGAIAVGIIANILVALGIMVIPQ